jgi:hypothetical protein
MRHFFFRLPFATIFAFLLLFAGANETPIRVWLSVGQVNKLHAFIDGHQHHVMKATYEK